MSSRSPGEVEVSGAQVASSMSRAGFRGLRGFRALLAALWVFAVGGPASAQSPDPDPIELGRALYARFGCYECHQYSGSGYQGAPGGARLVPLRLSADAFRLYLRNPAVPRRMPPYTTRVLADAEADAIYAFIRSLPEPRPLAEIPPLDEIAREIEAAGTR
jgi:hypothetical protein